MSHDDRERSYRVYLPTSVTEPDGRPVLLNLHGRKGTATEQELRLREQAEAGGFILVSPQGIGRSWNAGVGFGKAHAEGVDDVAFVGSLLEEISTFANYDTTRVFATGFSNGARMVHRLGCELADKIAAIAPIAGPLADHNPLTGERAFDCRPVRPVSVFTFHGGSDMCTPRGGGKGMDTDGNLSLTQTTKAWTDINQCTRQRRLQIGETVCTVHEGCEASASVVRCTNEGAGHVWPGGKTYLGWQVCGGDWPTDFDLNAEMLAFFESQGRRSPGVWSPRHAKQPDSAVDFERTPVRAPEGSELPFDRSKVVLEGVASSSRELESRDIGFSGLRVAGAVSLYSQLKVRPGKISLTRLLSQASVELRDSRTEGDGERVVRGSLGATALHISPARNLYALHLGVSISETTDTLAEPDFLPYAIGIGTYEVNTAFRWIYGLGFAYTFGRGLALPIGGLIYKPSKPWTLSVILPLLVNAKYAVSQTLHLGLEVAAAGERFRFSNDEMFVGRESVVALRSAQARVAATAHVRLSQRWTLRGALGIVSRGRVTISDSAGTISEEAAGGGVFVRTGFEFAWGNAPL